ncbi:MAG: response regulator, partial [Anaerolineales bacterium]
MDKSAAVPEEADKPVKEDAPGATEASSPASASVTEAEKPAPDTQPTEDHKPDTPTSDEISRPDPAAIVDQAEKPALVAKAPPPLEEVAPPAKTEPKTVSPATPKQSTTTTAQPEPAKPASDDTDKETLASKKVVLIVEDTIELAEVLQAKLETMGVTTIHESHANKALEVFKEKRPELVLLDIGLPDMSGWKLLDGIKEFDKENRPRFIIITA